MTKARLGLLWFFVAVLFFIAAMVKAENKAVYKQWGCGFLNSLNQLQQEEK